MNLYMLVQGPERMFTNEGGYRSCSSSQLHVQEPEASIAVAQEPIITGGPGDLIQATCPGVGDSICGSAPVVAGC